VKKIWKFLQTHWKDDFSPLTYALVLFLLAFLLITNYILDFEDSVLDSYQGFAKYFSFFLFYSIPYYLTVGITCKKKVWTPVFILKSSFALLVLSLDASLPFLRRMLMHVDIQIYFWLYKITVNAISLITVLLPLYLYYRLVEKTRNGFYGLTPEKFDARPYLQMLLIMVPLLIGAIFLPAFLKQYPMYRLNTAHEYLDVPAYVTALSYELAYAFDFLTVELLFRGFMVIGMAALLGRRAVIAMAVVYCLLHFGKPAGEAVSSIFGGYILGVIAYETRSIWGGVIVHVGIAWMMELISYIAKQW
jgi:hypothetical protein